MMLGRSTARNIDVAREPTVVYPEKQPGGVTFMTAMRKTWIGPARALSLLLGICVLGGVGCASSRRVVIEGERGRVIIDTEQRAEGGEPYYPSEVVKVPPGHLPPPGECRIWYPDRPPGHQPPPGNCRELERRVPPGAWLIRT
jgi:hypothetical protein